MKESNCFKKMMRGSTLLVLILVGIAVLALGPSVRAQNTGSGTLTINPGGMSDDCEPAGSGFMDFDSPHFWDILQMDNLGIHIAAGFKICTSGPDNDIDDPCTTDANCSTSNGKCTSNNDGVCTGTCSAGNVGANCTTNASCNVAGTCDVRRCIGGTNAGAQCSNNGQCDSNNCGGRLCIAGNVGASCTSDTGCNLAGTCNFSSATCTAGETGESCTASSQCNTGHCQPNSNPDNQTGACDLDDPNNGDDACNDLGKCEWALECSGETEVIITGHTGNDCNVDGDCSIPDGETTCDGGQTCAGNNFCSVDTLTPCTTVDDCPKIGLCRFEDKVSGTVAKECTDDGSSCETDADCTAGVHCVATLDVCYETRDDNCSQATMEYCKGACENGKCTNTGLPCENNNQCDGFAVNVENPNNTGTFVKTFLRTVELGDPCTMDSDCPDNAHCGESGVCEIELNTSEACTPLAPTTCQNVVGSLCCGLTQGAYGAPKSVATAQGECGGDTDLGYIPAAACDGCDVFDSECDNATTIGLFATPNSVTIDSLANLIAWLPTGGTAGKLKNPPGGNRCYTSVTPFPNGDLTGGGSKGTGGGVLSGQTMASQINSFLSDVCEVGPTGGAESFTASGFGGFTLPAAGVLVCTQRSGSDKVLGNDDDVCQAFGYANCVAGKTVEMVIACANEQLANGSNSCGCSAPELNNALSNINVQFDQCGEVIDCGDVTTAGVFTCP